MPPRGIKKGTKRARQYEKIKRSQQRRGALGAAAPRRSPRGPSRRSGLARESRGSAHEPRPRTSPRAVAAASAPGSGGPRGPAPASSSTTTAKQAEHRGPLADEQAPASGRGQPQAGKLSGSQAAGGPARSRARGGGAPARSLSCSTWRLSWLQRAAQVAAELRRRDPLGDPAGDARRRRRRRRSGSSTRVRPSSSSRSRQRPRWSTPGHRGPGHVALGRATRRSRSGRRPRPTPTRISIR